MFWKLFGSEQRITDALRQKTQVYNLSPDTLNIDEKKGPINWADIAYSDFAKPEMAEAAVTGTTKKRA